MLRHYVHFIWIIFLLGITAPAQMPQAIGLEDGTPVRLRVTETISSATAHVDDRVNFDVVDDVKVGDLVVIRHGSVAIGTVTEAQPKRRMGRGGKLNVNIDSTKTVTNEKVALRGVKDLKGGGHTGAMTGGMVATSIVFWPAAPFFLFMHGKDITVPKGHEFTVYTSGGLSLDPNRLISTQSATTSTGGSLVPTSAPANLGGTAALAVSSTPSGADIELDGSFVGSTPSSISVSLGDHNIAIRKTGYQTWQRTIRVSGGTVNVNAKLDH
jgi:PEGA domain